MPAQRVLVRTSERALFNSCRMAWKWSYIDRLKPRTSGMNALVFGSMVHRCLAEWYIPEKGKTSKPVRGRHPAETFNMIYKALERDGRNSEIRIDEGDEGKWVDAFELGMEMMTNYIDEFGLDEDIRVIYPEMPFQYVMRNAKGQYVCTYVGETDCLIRQLSTQRLGLFEHKTAASISTDHLFLDEQASTYWSIVPLWLKENGIVRDDDELDFMLYNFMRKGKKPDGPLNAKGQVLNKPDKAQLQEAVVAHGLDLPKPCTMDAMGDLLVAAGVDVAQLGTPSKRQPPPLFQRQILHRGMTERLHTYERIVHQVREMKACRNGTMEIYKSPSKDCSFCSFRDMCEMHEIGSDIDLLQRQTFRKWNPYKAHIWSLDLEDR